MRNKNKVKIFHQNILAVFVAFLISFNVSALTVKEIEKKANSGSSEHMLKMGVMYEKGINVEKDIEKSKKYYEKAIKSGEKRAYSRLGDIFYSQGKKESALEYWEKGKESGDYASIGYLGKYYYLKGDFHKSKTFLNTAAIKGVPIAQYYLSRIYMEGRIGAKNIVYGYVWMDLSSKNFPKAKSELPRIKNKMSGSQLAAAKTIKEHLMKKYFSEDNKKVKK